MRARTLEHQTLRRKNKSRILLCRAAAVNLTGACCHWFMQLARLGLWSWRSSCLGTCLAQRHLLAILGKAHDQLMPSIARGCMAVHSLSLHFGEAFGMPRWLSLHRATKKIKVSQLLHRKKQAKASGSWACLLLRIPGADLRACSSLFRVMRWKHRSGSAQNATA